MLVSPLLVFRFSVCFLFIEPGVLIYQRCLIRVLFFGTCFQGELVGCFDCKFRSSTPNPKQYMRVKNMMKISFDTT